MKRLLGLIVLAGLGCSHGPVGPPIAFSHPPKAPPTTPKTPEDKLVAALEDQLTWGTQYNGSYVQLAYPNGDLPRDRGVCTDVVIRAYRPLGFDLQQLVSEDARAHIDRYPRIGSTAKLDSNIDHRRCPNLISYFEKHAEKPTEWEPGDIVFWKLPGNADHVGMVSHRTAEDGTPLVIHNIPGGLREDNSLRAWSIVAHYRWQPWK
jgi:uncharacterized protein YijF (DUF1287 family)